MDVARVVAGAVVLAVILLICYFAGPRRALVAVGVMAAGVAAGVAGAAWRGGAGADRSNATGGAEPVAAKTKKDTEAALRSAYCDWILARKLLNEITAVEPSTQTRIVLESWLLYNPTREKQMKGFNRLRNAFKLAKFKKLDEIMAVVENALASTIEPPIGAAVEVTADEIRYAAYTLKRTPRIDRLVEIGGAEATIAAALRYASILASSHQWALPPAAFAVLWEEGFRNEAFASPFNANVVDHDGGVFFSLFGDVDAPFGSRGSFFEPPIEDQLKLPGGWAVNPPFTVQGLKEGAARAAQLAAKRDVIFITRQADPARGDNPYAAIEAVAKAARILGEGNHAYAVQGPEGITYRHGKFPTHVMYAGPRTEAQAEAMLDALVAQWTQAADSETKPANPSGRKMRADDPWFTDIAEGRKTVEGRVAPPGRLDGFAGEPLTLYGPGGAALSLKVVAVRHYPDLESFVRGEGWERIVPGAGSEEAAVAAHVAVELPNGARIFAPERVRKQGGIAALELELAQPR